MKIRMFVTAAFATQTVIGSFCFMTMAHAASMPEHDMHSEMEGMEMIMSPVVPMSPVDCEHCVNVEEPRYEEPIGMDMPCTSGHCISHAPSPAVSIIASASSHEGTMSQSLAVTFPPTIHIGKGNPAHAAAPPAQLYTKTVVLRF